MGAAVVKPHDSETNEAKRDMEQQTKGLEAIAIELFQSIRLGESTEHNLGYHLVGNKMTDQKIKIVTHSVTNATNDDIHNAVNSLFGQDWQGLVNVAADEFVKFLNQKATDSAQASIFSKSFLIWEDRSLLQVTCYVRKSLWGSSGTIAKDKTSVLLVGLARGVVAYETLDPQTLIYEVTKSNPDMSADHFARLMQETEDELKRATKLSIYKKLMVSDQELGAATASIFDDKKALA